MKPACVLLLLLLTSSAFSQPTASPKSLLDRMTGKWVLQGAIGGQQTTHDVVVEWILQREYVQLHEVSREKDSLGQPAYEAIVIIGWVERLHQYGCLWLDVTGVWDFSGQGIGRATARENEIPFLFKLSDTSAIRTTFVYDPTGDSWKWMIDDEENGKLQPFARVTLTRKK